MSYKIILDSCGELTDEMKKNEHYSNVPLTLQVGEVKIIDDETFNQSEFLNLVAQSDECPKSACPSPELYIKSFDCDSDNVYAVTLSAALSGSYNSAVLAKNLMLENNSKANVHIVDSKSASGGETLIAMKINEYETNGMFFNEIVRKIEQYRDSLSTLFVLEDLSFLERNGRLTGVKRLAVNLLNIVPIMSATKEGTIFQLGHARGIRKAMSKLISIIIDECIIKNTKRIVISHCNCPERAESIKKELMKKLDNITVYINNTRGVSSLYAGNKGIIVAFD